MSPAEDTGVPSAIREMNAVLLQCICDIWTKTYESSQDSAEAETRVFLLNLGTFHLLRTHLIKPCSLRGDF